MHVVFNLKPSRYFTCFIVFGHLGAWTAVCLSPLPVWLCIMCMTLTGVCAGYQLLRYALLLSEESVVTLQAGQEEWRLICRNGRALPAAELLGESARWGFVLLLIFRVNGKEVWKVPICRDMISQEAFRGLQVRLRLSSA